MTKKLAYKYKEFRLAFIPGMCLGLEFPEGELLGDYHDEATGDGQKTTFAILVDLLIFRLFYRRYYTTDVPDDE